MTLATLYIYDDLNAYLEYPETNATRPVSYLFRCDPCNWENPTRCFAYSPGKLSGQIRKGEEVVCALLPVEDGAKVPCIESHYIYVTGGSFDVSVQYIPNTPRPRCKSLPLHVRSRIYEGCSSFSQQRRYYTKHDFNKTDRNSSTLCPLFEIS